MRAFYILLYSTLKCWMQANVMIDIVELFLSLYYLYFLYIVILVRFYWTDHWIDMNIKNV